MMEHELVTLLGISLQDELSSREISSLYENVFHVPVHQEEVHDAVKKVCGCTEGTHCNARNLFDTLLEIERQHFIKDQGDQTQDEKTKKLVYLWRLKKEARMLCDRWSDKGLRAVLCDNGDSIKRTKYLTTHDLLRVVDDKYEIMQQKLYTEMLEDHYGCSSWEAMLGWQQEEKLVELQALTEHAFKNNDSVSLSELPGAFRLYRSSNRLVLLGVPENVDSSSILEWTAVYNLKELHKNYQEEKASLKKKLAFNSKRLKKFLSFAFQKFCQQCPWDKSILLVVNMSVNIGKQLIGWLLTECGNVFSAEEVPYLEVLCAADSNKGQNRLDEVCVEGEVEKNEDNTRYEKQGSLIAVTWSKQTEATTEMEKATLEHETEDTKETETNELPIEEKQEEPAPESRNLSDSDFIKGGLQAEDGQEMAINKAGSFEPVGTSGVQRERSIVHISEMEREETMRSLVDLQRKAESKRQRDKERQMLRVQERLSILRNRKSDEDLLGNKQGDGLKHLTENLKKEDKSRQKTLVREKLEQVRRERTHIMQSKRDRNTAGFKELLDPVVHSNLTRQEDVKEQKESV
ncbi:UNVERIFIED_CONTAM: hypothetical protein FKN15_017454 [Acipenser sinensis]